MEHFIAHQNVKALVHPFVQRIRGYEIHVGLLVWH